MKIRGNGGARAGEASGAGGDGEDEGESTQDKVHTASWSLLEPPGASWSPTFSLTSWHSPLGQPSINGSGVPKNGLTIGTFKRETTGIGVFEVKANPITIDELPTFRQWAASQVYFLGGKWLNEGQPISPSVSIGFTILLWVQKDLPENPTWDDIKNLLGKMYWKIHFPSFKFFLRAYT
ncbi:MAG: hypothetical protein AB4426_02980 [Xenococcaceae cyanobacterium]